MKTKKTIAIFSIALSTTVQAETLMHGVISTPKNDITTYQTNYPTWDSCNIFPDSLYTFENIKMTGLSYDKSVSKKDRLKDINDFTSILSGNLSLVSHDKNTNISKFKLFLKGGRFLVYNGNDYLHSNFIVDRQIQLLNGNGQVKFPDGSNIELTIEGSLTTVDGNTTWTSFNKNKYFDITVKDIKPNVQDTNKEKFSSCKYRIQLIRLQDNVPVIISTD